MYLLDVNVLLALAYDEHTLHNRAAQWLKQVQSSCSTVRSLVTCSIVELGFIRVAPGKKGLAPNLAAARADLHRIRSTLGFELVEDSLDGSRLPNWVTRANQTTDGHLLQLANHHGVRFATLDAGIPGAELVPHEGDFPTEVREPAHAGYFDMPIDEHPDKLIYDPAEPSPFPGYPYPRWAIDPVTGFPYVRARPGVPKITTEDVKRELEDFP